MFNYTASNTDALNATATNKAVSPLAAYSAYGRTAPVTVASTSTLLTTNNIIIATTAGVTLTLPLTSLYATAQLNAAQLVIYNSSAGSITIQGQSQFPSTAFSITGGTTSGTTYSLDATHLPTVVGGSIATNLFTATADNASAQSFDNVVGSGITAVTPQMVITPSSLFTVDGTSTNTTLVLLNSTSGLLSSGSKVWADDGGTMKSITTGNVVETTQDNSGAAWVQQTLPATDWSSITYGNGLFITVSGLTSATTIAATSLDGITWTQRTLPTSAAWKSVAYGNGLFVTAASGGTLAATSLDGVTWTQRTLPTSAAWQSVAYGNGIFVAIASASTVAATSPDGVTWTQRTLPSLSTWQSVTYGNGLFVVVGSNSIAATSPDGITWTQRTLPGSIGWLSVAYGNGTFVAISNPNGVVAASSLDGITWTQRTLPVISQWSSVSYGNGLFVAVSGGSTVAASSPDGITWTQRVLPTTANWQSIICGGNLFVVVSRGTNAATSNAGYFKKYTCTALSPSLTNVPTWVAKGGQTLAGSISTTSTPNFATVVPTSYTATRVSNTLTITANQLSGFTSGTHVQLKAQSLNNGDVMSALNAVSNAQGINGSATYTLNAGSSVTLIPTTTNAWIMG